jgi:6-phosphogluconolactonase
MIKCYPSVHDLVEKLADRFHETIMERVTHKEIVNIAISGGNTPKLFFEELSKTGEIRGKSFPWRKIHFFWVDERCVPRDHPESNFGLFDRVFIRKFAPGTIQSHRIRGEEDPYEEARRYSEEILNYVDPDNGIPVFDWIFLGIGEDGHTASIFPDRMELLKSDSVCEVSKHPVTGQVRITLTGNTLIRASLTTFIVTGRNKSRILNDIALNSPDSEKYPATYVYSESRNTELYLDREAAEHLNISCRG